MRLGTKLIAALALASSAAVEAAPGKSPFTVAAHVKLRPSKVMPKLGGRESATACASCPALSCSPVRGGRTVGTAGMAVAPAAAGDAPKAFFDLPPGAKLVFGGAGIYGAFMYYGLLQERVFKYAAMDGSRFTQVISKHKDEGAPIPGGQFSWKTSW